MSDRPLGIICALSGEVKTLSREKIGIGTVISIADGIWLTISGMGAQRAQTAAKLLLQRGATALLSWGIAGALDDKLSLGNLILPKIILSADGEASTVTQNWHEHLYRHLAGRFTIHLEPLVETKKVASTALHKQALHTDFGAIATDMESAALARLAKEASVPFLAIRAISDTAQMAIPKQLLKVVNSIGDLPRQHILTGVILNPRDWLVIAKFAWGVHAAQTSLRRVVGYLGPQKLATIAGIQRI